MWNWKSTFWLEWLWTKSLGLIQASKLILFHFFSLCKYHNFYCLTVLDNLVSGPGLSQEKASSDAHCWSFSVCSFYCPWDWHHNRSSSILAWIWKIFHRCITDLYEVNSYESRLQTKRESWTKPKGYGLFCHKVWDVDGGEFGLMTSLPHSSHTGRRSFVLFVFSWVILFGKWGD